MLSFFENFKSRKITLADVLHGCKPGRIQSVGYMQVIPLVSELSDDRYVSPVEAESEVFTTNYGTLGFRNPTDRVMIVPCHAGYVVKQAAQDHAMAHAGIVGSSGQQSFKTAMCIQSSQGGLIERGAYEMLILPYALRERALAMREQQNYGKLWNDISSFNNELGLPANGHLEHFMKNFRKQLDEFVAEFECVPNQIGAIILVDDQVVGIERAPSHAYWESVWPCLIRECYGSQAIRVARRKGTSAEVPSSQSPLPENIGSLDELESVLSQIAEEEEERTKATVRQLLGESLTLTRDESVAGLAIETVSAGRFIGQVIREGHRIVYASLPTSRQWFDDNRWQTASPFSI